MFFLELLNESKKYATLLPKNWLAKTPQTLASRRLGRKSAERSGFLKSTGIFKEKLQAGLFRTKF
ncbi:hypothetical protein KEH51_18305 [[Brevibacterium] frigoritolerans]|uniref:Uncharacterized protein n=1 Tax=Peribacillus frigoritolerans TaxID=450367 RepID=A0A941J867_9BACI|nr:hypothetical protein [Peribacillus frigoritolerans]